MPRGKRTGDFHSKDKRNLPIFIHSELDDYGLTAIEFRVYARIARRAGEYNKLTESVPNMATAFGVAEITVRRALQVLVLCDLVAKKGRPGWTPEYTLNDKDKWRDKARLVAIREAVSHPKKGDVTLLTREGGVEAVVTEPDARPETGALLTTDGTPCSSDTDEGTPLKVLPEGAPSTPPSSKQEHPRQKGVKKEIPAEKFDVPPTNLRITPEMRSHVGTANPDLTNAQMDRATPIWRANRVKQPRQKKHELTYEGWEWDWIEWMMKQNTSTNGNGYGNGAKPEPPRQRTQYEILKERGEI